MMAQPGEIVGKRLRVVNAAGTGVTGLLISDFTVTSYYRPKGGSWTSYSAGAALTSLGSGLYGITYALPSVPAQYFVQIIPNSSSNFASVEAWEDEAEAQDLDAMYGLVARPIVTVSGQGTVGQIKDVTITSHRNWILTYGFADQTGTPIDMTSGTVYANYKVGFRGVKDQTATPPKLDAIHGTPAGFGITGGLGFLTVTIPMGCTIFNALPEGASVADSIVIKYEITGERVAAAGERVALVASSNMTLTRREEGAA